MFLFLNTKLLKLKDGHTLTHTLTQTHTHTHMHAHTHKCMHTNTYTNPHTNPHTVWWWLCQLLSLIVLVHLSFSTTLGCTVM